MHRRFYLFFLLAILNVIPLLAKTNLPEERVSICTDKDVYIAGDWVYFSVLISNPENPVSDFVYIAANGDHQNQIFTGLLKISDHIASGSFYLPDTLSTGVYQLVAYTNNLRNYGPEGYGIKGILVANRFDSEVKKIKESSGFGSEDTTEQSALSEGDSIIYLNKEVFSEREEARLDIRLPEGFGNTVASVSVRKVAPVKIMEEKTPLSSIHRMSGCQYLPERSGIILQGTVKEQPSIKTVFLSCEDSTAKPQYAQTNSNGEFSFSLNPRYLGKKLTIGLQGEDRSAIQIRTDYNNGNTENIQLSGIMLQGTVTNKPTKKTVFLSCEDSVANLQFTETNSDGEFRFFLNPYYFGKEIAIRLQGEDPSTIQIDSKYFTGNIGELRLQISGDLEGYLQKDIKYLIIRKSYKEDYRLEHPVKAQIKSWRPEIYSRQGEVVIPSDYEYLPDFRSISQELLGYYKIRQRKNELVGTLLDINQNENTIPFIFLDGILLEHVRQIMPLSSKRVKQVVTIPSARYMGNMPIPGILDIQSFHNEIHKVQWRYPVSILNIEKPMPFSSINIPNLGKMPHHIPAFLPLLYWNPDVKISHDNPLTLSFYTSDCTGTFEVLFKGLTTEGQEVEYRKIFEVRSKN